MKKYNGILTSLIVMALIASSALAAFDIPSYVYRIDQLQQAIEKAKAENKQIVFLYSNANTDCPLASRASIKIMERFKSSAVIVYAGREDWEKIPRIVKHAINSPEAGKYIPKTIVVDFDITSIVAIIPYERP